MCSKRHGRLYNDYPTCSSELATFVQRLQRVPNVSDVCTTTTQRVLNVMDVPNVSDACRTTTQRVPNVMYVAGSLGDVANIHLTGILVKNCFVGKN